jgi:hypothetical protein
LTGVLEMLNLRKIQKPAFSIYVYACKDCGSAFDILGNAVPKLTHFASLGVSMRFLSIGFAMLILISGSVWGQGSQVAQISGTVTDSSGAAVSGADVKATQTETGLSRAVITGNDGAFAIPNLAIGSYRLQVQMQGFSTLVQEGIVLQVNTKTTINSVLKPGAITEIVVIQASGSVDAGSGGQGQVVDQERVREMPLPGRQVTSLVTTSGGTTEGQDSALVSNKNYPGATSFSVAGAQGGQTLYLLDGVVNMDAVSMVSMPWPFPDALQEFKVESSSLPANYGLAPGGVVNVITKSGGNQFHGGAFEFTRHYKFNATNTFAAPDSKGKRLKDGLKRNQFGGQLGGPIVKDKIFFFGGYQGTRENVTPAANINWVATPATLLGDFTAIASPACNAGRAITLKAPFVNNKIDPSLINPVAKNLLKYLPVSNDPCGQIAWALPSESRENQLVGKVDWKVNDQHSIAGRYFFTDYKHPPFYEGNLLTFSVEQNVGLKNRVQSVMIGHTFSISSTTINSFRLGYARSSIVRYTPDTVPTPTELGSKMHSLVDNYLYYNVSNYFMVLHNNANPGPWATNNYQISEELSMTRGGHQISAGALWVQSRLVARGTYQNNGPTSFNGQVTGNALADFILGKSSSFSQSSGQNGDEKLNLPSAFVQDNIRVSSKLAVNIGVRWDPFMSPINTKLRASIFDMGWYNSNVRSKVFTNGPVGTLFVGDSEYPGNRYFRRDLGYFSPRFGIVYDPRGKGLENIRAGYGIFYATIPLWTKSGTFAPWSSSVSIPTPAGGISDPYLGYPGGDPFPMPAKLPSDFAFPMFGGSIGAFKIDMQPTYLEQWIVAVQKQLTGTLAVSASYMGNRTLHLLFGEVLNPVIYIPGNCTAGQYGLTKDGPCSNTSNTNYRRVLYLANPTKGYHYSGQTNQGDGGIASYNGLLLTVQKRMSRNFSLVANHTWAHCLGEGEVSLSGSGSGQDPYNRHAEYGNCSSTRRHSFNLTPVIRTPKFSSRWMQAMLGNWQASTMFSAMTGPYFTVSLGQNYALRDGSDRPNQIKDAKLDKPTVDKWFDISAFERAPVGQYGNITRGILQGPGAWNINLALSRSFTFFERHKIDFRGEIFNLLNHVRYSTPTATFTSGTFGKITKAMDPRIMQFAFKYAF